MNNIENVFCRFCAELKPHNELINLQTDDNKCTEIITKLSRFDLQKNLSDNLLPKMVCVTCYTSLNLAFNCVTVLEKAQSKLNDVVLTTEAPAPATPAEKQPRQAGSSGAENEHVVQIQQTKQEQNVSMDYHLDNDSSSKESDVQIQNPAVESDKKEQSIAVPIKRKYKKKKDSIPLTLTQMKLSWQSFKWQCIVCRDKFPTSDMMRAHSMARHNICNPFHCSECKERKVNLDKFVKHMKQHKPYLRMSCYICFKEFKSVVATNKHIKETHTTSGFVCPGCNMSFNNSEDLYKHTKKYKKGGTIRVIDDM